MSESTRPEPTNEFADPAFAMSYRLAYCRVAIRTAVRLLEKIHEPTINDELALASLRQALGECGEGP